MSMVIYMNDTIIADRLCINADDDNIRLSSMQKIHISKCRRFAFGYCGARLLKRQLADMETYILGVLTMAVVNKDPYKLVAVDDATHDHAHSLFKHQHVMLITRDAVYERDPKYSGVFVLVETDDVIVQGTYGNAVYTGIKIMERRLEQTLNAEEMCATAGNVIEYISGRPDPTIDYVCRSQLNAFVVSDVSNEKVEC